MTTTANNLNEEQMNIINELKERENDVWVLKGYIKQNNERIQSIPIRTLNSIINVDGYKFIKSQGKMYFNINYYKRRGI